MQHTVLLTAQQFQAGVLVVILIAMIATAVLNIATRRRQEKEGYDNPRHLSNAHTDIMFKIVEVEEKKVLLSVGAQNEDAENAWYLRGNIPKSLLAEGKYFSLKHTALGLTFVECVPNSESYKEIGNLHFAETEIQMA